jgi:hypothetical protein
MHVPEALFGALHIGNLGSRARAPAVTHTYGAIATAPISPRYNVEHIANIVTYSQKTLSLENTIVLVVLVMAT